MVNYANFNQRCVDEAMTPFMQYLPFIMLLQAVAIIMIEKMLMKFPRVAGKIERFYGSIVEEALFGKDPDVAEDVMDDKANAEAISRSFLPQCATVNYPVSRALSSSYPPSFLLII